MNTSSAPAVRRPVQHEADAVPEDQTRADRDDDVDERREASP